MTLPADTILVICEFVDDLRTIANLRASCAYIYSIAIEYQDRFLATVEPVIMFDSRTCYRRFYEDVFNQLRLNSSNSWFRYLLTCVVNGGIRLMEQYGFQETRFIFVSLYEVLISALPAHREAAQVISNVLATYSEIWEVLAEKQHPFLPKTSLLQLCATYATQSQLSDALLLLNNQVAPLKNVSFQHRDYESCVFTEIVPKCSIGFTMLHFCAWMNDRQSINTLITQCSFHVDTPDLMNRTILHYCVIDDKLYNLLEWLINDCKANPFIPDCEGLSPTAIAHLHEKEDALSLLKAKYGQEKIDVHIQAALDQHAKTIDLNQQNPDTAVSEASDDDEECEGEHEIDSLDEYEESDDAALREAYNEGNSDFSRLDIKYPRKLAWGFNKLEDIDCYRKYRHCYKDKYSDHFSDCFSIHCSEEEGLDYNWIMDHKVEEVEEAIKHFESITLKHWNNQEMNYDCVKIKVLSRYPIKESNESVDDATEAIHSDTMSKKRKLCTNSDEENGGPCKKLKTSCDLGIVKRRDMVFSKRIWDKLFWNTVDRNFQVEDCTPLAKFIIQNTAENLLSTVFELSHTFANFYKRDYIHALDFQYALLSLSHENRVISNNKRLVQDLLRSQNLPFRIQLVNTFSQFSIHHPQGLLAVRKSYKEMDDSEATERFLALAGRPFYYSDDEDDEDEDDNEDTEDNRENGSDNDDNVSGDCKDQPNSPPPSEEEEQSYSCSSSPVSDSCEDIVAIEKNWEMYGDIPRLFYIASDASTTNLDTCFDQDEWVL